MIKLSQVKFDCRHFKGSVPCKPNKLYGAVCDDCGYYEKTEKRILIIKLGAAGDVIRTTPLLHPLKKKFPGSKIYWLTYHPDLVPLQTKPCADVALAYNLQNIAWLYATEFDLIVNLDKDNEAISAAQNISAKEKFGFVMKDGYCSPADKNAEHKFLTGIFDKLSIENRKSYPEEIFEICGFKFNKEKYLIDTDMRFEMDFPVDANKEVIGLNTGCGERWTSRMWKDEHWLALIRKLIDEGFEVVLLGGPSEDKKNSFLNEVTGAKYFGYFDLKTFINLINKCDAVVTQVTMAMHIAIALEKKLILMNNIFNPNEFELYGNGGIVSPRKECKCFFQPKCINPDYECMDHLMPEDVYNECVRQFQADKVG